MTATCEETGPAGPASNSVARSHDSTKETLFPLALAAAELVDDITSKAAEDAQRDEATFRYAFRLGFEHGRDVGYAQRVAEEQRAADAFADNFHDTIPVDLMTRRWGPGGRKAFGQPRATDFKGGAVAPW